MHSPFSVQMALIATFAAALVVFATRLLPFALFSRREPPALIRFVERYIPSLIMAILLVYSLKDTAFLASPFGIPQLAALAAVVLLHLTLKNSMVSIFGGTLLFMLLSHLW